MNVLLNSMSKFVITVLAACFSIGLSTVAAQIGYPMHLNTVATVFWIGEEATPENGYIDNKKSAWDDNWLEHYGGVDEPENRHGYMPAKFIPHENPFYFALPYDDFNDDGTRKSEAYHIVYWSHQKNWNESESMLKNRWIKITNDYNTCYAQWQDAGPYEYDDSEYVFGNALPKNEIAAHSGLDVSPAVRDCLDPNERDINVVSWQFVDFNQVPDGPWKKIVTTSQTSWGTYDLSPLKQFKLGIKAEDVKCKQNFQLVIKSRDHSPACVKPTSKPRLISIGWALP